PVLTGQDQFILIGLVFCSLGPVLLQSFSSYETRLPNTNEDTLGLPLPITTSVLNNSMFNTLEHGGPMIQLG
ncbi:hypothetical protein K443DRAFT_92979, partial [Laccaria amethystina LaAM-08-1]